MKKEEFERLRKNAIENRTAQLKTILNSARFGSDANYVYLQHRYETDLDHLNCMTYDEFDVYLLFNCVKDTNRIFNILRYDINEDEFVRIRNEVVGKIGIYIAQLRKQIIEQEKIIKILPNETDFIDIKLLKQKIKTSFMDMNVFAIMPFTSENFIQLVNYQFDELDDDLTSIYKNCFNSFKDIVITKLSAKVSSLSDSIKELSGECNVIGSKYAKDVIGNIMLRYDPHFTLLRSSLDESAQTKDKLNIFINMEYSLTNFTLLSNYICDNGILEENVKSDSE